MSTARTEMLANIRRALGVSGQEAPRLAAVADRLAHRPTGVIPARGHRTADERVELFSVQAERAAATVGFVATQADVPEAIARFLRDHNLPATLCRGADARLARMPWDRTALAVETSATTGDDLNAVSHATGAVAESGTLVLVSGPDNPTSLNFLPDNHVVVVAAADIAGDYETVLARIQEDRPSGGLPRSINLITGPSRSGDIEQKLILGAHGPRRLHIIVVSG